MTPPSVPAADDRLRVLVVEADAGMASRLATALSGADSALDGSTASTLRDALRSLGKRPPAVCALVGMDLPDTVGFDALAAIIGRHRDMPVIALTSDPDDDVALTAIDHGAVDVIVTSTPIEPNELVRRVRLAIARKRTQSAIAAADERRRRDIEARRPAPIERLGAVVEHASDIISIHDPDGRLRWTSASAARLLGLDSSTESGDIDVDRHLHPDDRQLLQMAFAQWSSGERTSIEYRVFDTDGDIRHVESMGTNLLDHPGIEGIVVTTRDITERRAAQRELARAALHDQLTDLPNRTLLLDRLAHALAAHRGGDGAAALVLVDIDHFKVVNDSLGHEVGDSVIAAVGDVLRTAAAPNDTVGRIGGDNFAICMPDIGGVDAALAAAERIAAEVANLVEADGHRIHITASIGVAVATAASEADQLLADAEVAMYRAKDRGRARVELFDDDARERVVGRVTLRRELREAVQRGEFRLFFQPQVRIETGEIVSFEALLRWEHPTRGLLNPAAFIAVAEETRIIDSIGRWVLEESCHRAAEWRKQFPEKRLSISVNLSAQQLADANLPDIVAGAIAAAGIDPSAICLELTESMLMEDAEGAVAILRRLKESGVRLAIDDFGTGYSSLAYLKRFPIDLLKVDRSFVDGLGRDPEDFVIVSAVVNLAKSLGVEVVAEGVENERHVAELNSIGCQLAQGYLWSPPVPAMSVPALLQRAAVVPTTRPVAAADRSTDRPNQAIDVVSLLTHELRAPLTVIKGYAETLVTHLDGEVSPIVTKAASAIARNVSQLDELIATLTDVNALETGILPLNRQVTDAVEAVRVILADHADTFPDHAVQLTEHGPEHLVNVDVARVQQILLNLLSNAAKFSPPATTIEVDVTATEADVHISVSDRGPGVPPELVGEIFRKFFRVDNSKKGTGLGLYVARSLARAHGGDLTCRQAATGGAEFVLTLPRTDAPVRLDRLHQHDDTRRATELDSATTRVVSAQMVAVLEEARRALPSAETPEQAVGILIEAVRALGGGAVPARLAQASALPIELSCGIGEPLLVTAEPASDARSAIEAVLPALIDDARAVVDHLAHRDGGGASDGLRVDPVTGLAGRRVVARTIARLRDGSVVALLRTAGGDDNALRNLGRVLREHLPQRCSAGRFGTDQIALLLTPGTTTEMVDILDVVRRAWTARYAADATLAAGVAAVGATGAQAALLAADEASRRESDDAAITVAAPTRG